MLKGYKIKCSKCGKLLNVGELHYLYNDEYCHPVCDSCFERLDLAMQYVLRKVFGMPYSGMSSTVGSVLQECATSAEISFPVRSKGDFEKFYSGFSGTAFYYHIHRTGLERGFMITDGVDSRGNYDTLVGFYDQLSIFFIHTKEHDIESIYDFVQGLCTLEDLYDTIADCYDEGEVDSTGFYEITQLTYGGI